MKYEQRIHIISHGNRWVVKKEKTDKLISNCRSKERAVIEARIFKKLGYDVIIHRTDGSVESWEKSDELIK